MTTMEPMGKEKTEPKPRPSPRQTFGKDEAWFRVQGLGFRGLLPASGQRYFTLQASASKSSSLSALRLRCSIWVLPKLFALILIHAACCAEHRCHAR